MARRGRPPYPDVLTPREWEVLSLLREGRSNEEIARRLDVSLATAKYHVSEILSKLGVASREEAAAWRPEAEPPRWWAAARAALAWPLRRLWPLTAVQAVGIVGVVAVAIGLGVLGWSLLGGEMEGDSQALNPRTNTPSAAPTPGIASTFMPSPTPAPNLPEVSVAPDPPRLAYEDARGIIWLVGRQGGSQFRLTDRCGAVQMEWSPDGSLLACSYITIRIFDLQGRIVWQKDDTAPMGYFVWAPDSRQFAFRDSDQAIHIADVREEGDRPLAENGLPIAWLADGRLVAGLNVEELDLGIKWDTYLLDIGSGTRERAPRLDQSNILLFPDRRTGVVSTRNDVVLHNFETGDERAIAATGVDGTPISPVAVSTDGSTFYGFERAQAPDTGTIIYRCSVATAGCASLGTVPGLLTRASGDGLISYLKPGTFYEPMSIRDMRSGTEVLIGVATPHMAWWP